jgi:hypothetical protein
MIYLSDMKFEKALENIAENIKQYRQMKTFNGEELLTILQQIVGTLHYLEGQRAEAYKSWTERVYHYSINEGDSINKAEMKASVEVQELYLLRHIMNSGYKNVEAIRSTLSWLRNEKQSSKGESL